MVVNLSPSSLVSKMPCNLTKHSLSGPGPGALPPAVINLAPFGLISEKSKSIDEVPEK